MLGIPTGTKAYQKGKTTITNIIKTQQASIEHNSWVPEAKTAFIFFKWEMDFKDSPAVSADFILAFVEHICSY